MELLSNPLVATMVSIAGVGLSVIAAIIITRYRRLAVSNNFENKTTANKLSEEMIFNDLQKLDLPIEFPTVEYAAFMEAARSVLLPPAEGEYWKEFGGASNLIGWRYRSSYEYMRYYVDSWQEKGSNISFEEIYMRDRALFGMFTSGVSCIDCTSYALLALASHPSIISLAYGDKERRRCSPKSLQKKLQPHPLAQPLVDILTKLNNSDEWRLWVDLRNRLTHRSNLPRITQAAMGGTLPPAKSVHFAATSSTPHIEANEELLLSLFSWLSISLKGLLNGGYQLVENSKLPVR